MPDTAKGDLPLLVLCVLADEPGHGYAIARRIAARSSGALLAPESALYPALRALETAGQIIGSWQTPTSGPARKVYTITALGLAARADRAGSWVRYASAIQEVIAGGLHAKPA